MSARRKRRERTPVHVVLIVHADGRFCELIQMALTGDGFEICSATDGDEAIDQLRRHSPDIVLIDELIATGDGREFCALLRDGSLGRRVPLVTVSEKSSVEASRVAALVGAEDFVSRPFAPPELAMKVRRVLERHAETRVLVQSVNELEGQLRKAQQDLDDAHACLKDQRVGMQAVVDFSNRMDPRFERDEVESRCLRQVSSLFEAAGLCLFRRPRDESAWMVPSRSEGIVTDRIASLRLPVSGEFVRILATAGRPLCLEEFERIPGTAWEAGSLTAAGFSVVVPFLVRRELTGFLALAEKTGGRRLGPVEIEVLSLIAAAMSQFLESARVAESGRELTVSSLGILVDRLESAHPFLAGHSRRVSRMAEAIGRHLGLSARDLEDLLVAACLHDVGRTFTDPDILSKPGPLTPEEWTEVQKHPILGARLAAEANWSEPVLAAIRHHHEAWSGDGYPSGICRDAIPLAARIIAVADAYDAMRSARPHRGPMSETETRRQLLAESGTKFDPLVIEAAMALTGEIRLDSTG